MKKFYQMTDQIHSDSRIEEFIDPSDFDSALHNAMIFLTETIEGTPSDPQLRLLQASALQKVGQHDDALLNTEIAIALLSNDFDEEALLAANGSRATRNQAAVLRTAILNEMGLIEEAETALHDLLLEDLTNRRAAELLGEIVMTTIGRSVRRG